MKTGIGTRKVQAFGRAHLLGSLAQTRPPRINHLMTAPTGTVIEVGAAAGTESATAFHAQVLDRNVDEHGLPHLSGEIEHEPIVKDHSVLSSQLVIGSPSPANGPQG